MIHLDAIFENGVFRPEGPLDLADHTRVHLIVQNSSASAANVGNNAVEKSMHDIVVRQQNDATGGPPPWMRYAGTIETGDPNSSQRIDEIIYGEQP